MLLHFRGRGLIHNKGGASAPVLQVFTLAFIASEMPLENIMNLYASGPILMNPICRRGIRLLSTNASYTLNAIRFRLRKDPIRHLVDTVRIILALYRERMMQQRTFALPSARRCMCMCQGLTSVSQ